MKLSIPKPFTFKSGKRAVLLLHGFTGNSADVRMIGRFLEKNGYTSHAPHYKGHAVPPEELVKTGPEDWWKDVVDGYNHLLDIGCEEIAVCGLSLGGVFALKLGYTKPIKGIISMCAPMSMEDEATMYNGVVEYARGFKKFEGKSEGVIEEEIEVFKQTPMNTLNALRDLVQDVRNHIDHIYAPTFIVQARLDKMIDTNSANIIFDSVETDEKQIKWYEQSGHVITLDKEKEQLHEDILSFLKRLDWTV
ncbi:MULTISPECIES: carboxylesterase [Bacillaceae]|uniref:Carboxylesterase n=1 Tax=Domibacillus aminovorans TaxID=29332 RepID=A0A177KMU2_9BACI|nr:MULTISPECIES: carboxylesterase [Bacillaceae]OAH54693.1 carboxylesterase [Domibacillus aminovorans]